MSDEAVISYSSDIVVKVRHNQDVRVELSSQGPQGPQGEKGDTGDITPELNQARLDAQAAATGAKASETEAATSRTSAATSATSAKTSETNAKTSETNALASKNAAATSEANAKASETAAKTSETNAASSSSSADASKTAAETARSASETARTDAQSARADAIAARDAAQTAKTGAETAQTGAVTARNQASGYADAAKASAEAAALYDPSSIAYQRMPTPASGTSLNAVTTRGVYFFETSADITTALGFPSASTLGRLIVDVSNNGTNIMQDYQALTNAAAHWRRYSSNGGTSWSSWTTEFTSATFSTISQAEAEAGVATSVRWWTAQRVSQAIAALAATKVHTHEIAQINGLQAQLDAFINSPAFTGTPTVPTATAGDRSLAIANTQYVREALDAMIGAAPGTLDTLQEIADALGDDPNFAATMTQALAGKSDSGHKHVMADITDLAAAIAALAPKASPALTGTPTAPTAAATVNNTQIATTAHVKLAIANAGLATSSHTHVIADVNGLQTALDAKAALAHTHVAADITDLAALLNAKAALASPALTGNPTAPTQAVGNNSTRIATTAFAMTAVANATSGKADTVHSHAISDITSLQAALDAKLSLTGGAMTGVLTSSAEIQSTSSNSYRLIAGNYGIFQRFDGSSWYLMLTASGDQTGSYNSFRPLSVNASSGLVTAGNGLSVGNSFYTSGAATFTSSAEVRGQLNLGLTRSLASWTTAGAAFDSRGVTFTDNSSAESAIIADRVANSFGRPTLASTTATTVTRAATVYINNSPAAGANMTITNAYALLVDAGDSLFEGSVTGTGVADFARFYGTNTDTAAAPSFTNASDLNTGMWFPAADQIGFTVGGTNLMTLSANTLTISGTANAALEIGRTGAASTPFIDFHSGATATDYDARIIASGGTGSVGGGSLAFTCASASFSGTLTATSFSGSGASLTSLNASNLSSGTVADARIPSLAISKITGLQTALNAKLAATDKAASATTADQLGGVVAANWLRRDIDQQMGGNFLSRPTNQSTAQNDDGGNLRIQNASGTGDTAVAAMTFLCQNNYGIKMHLRADGYFGLGGWSRAAWSWYSAPDGAMVAAGNIGAYSDPRLKDDVVVIDNALDIIQTLRGVRFTWNNKTKLLGSPGTRDIGVLADEVEAVLPEIVGRSIPDEENSGEQWRTVAYDKLTPVLIQAIKELRAEVTELKGRAA